MDINIESQIVVKTEAQWTIDATVYSQQRILITSDVTYTGIDQRKFKIANGVDTWVNLNYMPIAVSTNDLPDSVDKRYVTDAEKTILSNTSGTNTGDQDLSAYEPLKGADDNYVTDAEKIVIGNTSGTNTGDQDLSNYATFAQVLIRTLGS